MTNWTNKLSAAIAVAATLAIICARKGRLRVIDAHRFNYAPVTLHKHYCDAARDTSSWESLRRVRVLREIDMPNLAIAALEIGANDDGAIAIRRACRT